MKRLILSLLIVFCSLVYYSNQANALIKLDDESVKIAIKYGLDNKYANTKDLMGPNWMEGEDGIILTIYSPFIQLATKARSQAVPGTSDEDIVLVKRRLGRQLNQIRTRQDIRFILQISGDNRGFGGKYDAYIEEYIEKPTEEEAKKAEENKGMWPFKLFKKAKKAAKIMPDEKKLDSNAELDNYNPLHPYTCTNSYNFGFEGVNKLDKFYFVLKGPRDKEYKFLIEKNVIF